MKTHRHRLLSIAAMIATGISFMIAGTSVRADEKDGNGHSHAKKMAGPNGGRLITSVKPRLEFFVTKDRKVQITAVDDHNKPIAITGQSVKVTGGSRFLSTRMKFENKGGVLISIDSFPQGKKLPVVVQIKATPESKTVIEKFYLDQNICPQCKHEEYACICGHDH